MAPLAPSVLNRIYAQTSNTNNGAAGEDIGATSGDKLAEVRLDTKCLKTQVSVVTQVTQLRSKTSDLNAAKPLALETSTLRTDATLAVGLALVKPNLRMRRVGGSEVVEPTEVAPATGLAQLQTKYEIEILRLFEGFTWPHDDTNDIGLTLDNRDPRQGVLTERHPKLATITINHVLRILKIHFSEGERKASPWRNHLCECAELVDPRSCRTSPTTINPPSFADAYARGGPDVPKWQQRMLPTSVPEVVAQAIAFGTNLRTGLCSLKPLARFLRNQGGHYALEPPHSLLAGGHFIETYAATMAQPRCFMHGLAAKMLNADCVRQGVCVEQRNYASPCILLAVPVPLEGRIVEDLLKLYVVISGELGSFVLQGFTGITCFLFGDENTRDEVTARNSLLPIGVFAQAGASGETPSRQHDDELRSNLTDVTTAPKLCELVAAGRYGCLGLDTCSHVDGGNVKFQVTNTEVDNRDPTESGRLTSIITTNEVDNRDLNKLGRLTSNATNVEVHNRHSTELGRLTSNATQEDPLRVVVSARAETLNGATNMPSARLVGRDGVRPTVVKPPVFAQGGDGGGRDTPVFAQAGAGGGLALEKPTLRMRRVGGPEAGVPKNNEFKSLASSAPHNRGTQIQNTNDGATNGWEKHIQEMNSNAKSAEGLASVKPAFAQASAGGSLVVEPKAATTTVSAMSTDLVRERSWWLGLPLLHNRRLLWECLEFPAAASSEEGLAKTTSDQTAKKLITYQSPSRWTCRPRQPCRTQDRPLWRKASTRQSLCLLALFWVYSQRPILQREITTLTWTSTMTVLVRAMYPETSATIQSTCIR